MKYNDFVRGFKEGKINIKIENNSDIEKIINFCINEGIEYGNIRYTAVDNYIFCEDNILYNTDEYLIDEFSFYGVNELKVDFSMVEKFFK